MDRVPNVVGFHLDKAMKVLELSESEIFVKATESPKRKEDKGECRVVRQKRVDDHIELTISYF